MGDFSPPETKSMMSAFYITFSERKMSKQSACLLLITDLIFQCKTRDYWDNPITSLLTFVDYFRSPYEKTTHLFNMLLSIKSINIDVSDDSTIATTASSTTKAPISPAGSIFKT